MVAAAVLLLEVLWQSAKREQVFARGLQRRRVSHTHHPLPPCILPVEGNLSCAVACAAGGSSVPCSGQPGTELALLLDVSTSCCRLSCLATGCPSPVQGGPASSGWWGEPSTQNTYKDARCCRTPHLRSLHPSMHAPHDAPQHNAGRHSLLRVSPPLPVLCGLTVVE